jgi:hypothetical protein
MPLLLEVILTDNTGRKAPGRKNMAAAEERKDIRFYLRPTKAENEKYAAEMLDKRQGEIQEQMRLYALAGLAIAEVDSRLPAVLASMLKPGVSGNEVEAVLRAFLNMGSAPMPEPTRVSSPPKNESAENLRTMLPE